MPATNTYIPIASVTLSSSASQVNFTALPSSFRDLVLVCEGVISAGGGEVIRVNFNNDTVAANYPVAFIDGNGSSASSGTDNRRLGLFYPNRTNIIAYFQDYNTNDRHKCWLARSNGASNVTFLGTGRWASNTAISSISIFPDANNFAAGSTFNLYGVVA